MTNLAHNARMDDIIAEISNSLNVVKRERDALTQWLNIHQECINDTDEGLTDIEEGLTALERIKIRLEALKEKSNGRETTT
jgi:septal ring factor EnvC (AmiA/AmiB activator)